MDFVNTPLSEDELRGGVHSSIGSGGMAWCRWDKTSPARADISDFTLCLIIAFLPR
jgi:hypothetical protein